jgi:hypothetical protein
MAHTGDIFILVVAKIGRIPNFYSSIIWATALFLVTVLGLGGCSDATGLLPRVNSDAQAQVEFGVSGTLGSRTSSSVQVNDVIAPTIRLTGDFLLNPPDSAILTIENRDREVVIQYPAITGDFTNPRAITSFNLSDLGDEPGLYYFLITFYRNSQEVARQRTPFFFNPPPIIVGEVQSYPSPFIAGGYGLLQAAITPPETSLEEFKDPFLRWTHEDGRVLAQGLLSEGFHTVPVRAPTRSGVFRVALEIYPFGPRSGEIFDFPAPVRREFTSAVASVPRVGPTDFGPAEQFPILLHFNGTLDNSGTSRISFDSSSIILPGLRGRTFGFEFLPDRYLTHQQFLLPLASDNRLKNSSTMFLGVVDFLPQEDPIILFASHSPTVSVEYRINSQGAMEASIRRNEQSMVIRSLPNVITEPKPNRPPQPIHLAYSLYRSGENDLGILLIANGVIRGGGIIPGVNQPLGRVTGPAETRIGYNLSGVIDEFGIFTGRDPEYGELVSDLYRNRLELPENHILQFAYSFEGLSGLDQEGLEGSDQVTHLPGKLIIPPGDWVAVPRVALESTQLNIFLGTSVSSRWIFGSFEIDLGVEEGTLVVGLDGVVRLIRPDSTTVIGFVTPTQEGELTLILEIIDQSLVLTSPNLTDLVKLPLSHSLDLLSFRVHQDSLAPGDLFLERIGVTRRRSQLLHSIQ